MIALRRFSPLALSLAVHAGVLGVLLGAANLPDLGNGASAEDLGGDTTQSADLVAETDDLDFGPATVQIVGIGIVDDAAPPAPAASSVAAPATAKAPGPKAPPSSPPPRAAGGRQGGGADVTAAAPVEAGPPAAPADATVATPAALASTVPPVAADAAPAEPALASAADAAPEGAAAPNPDHTQGHGLHGGHKPAGKGHHTTCPVVDDDGIDPLTATSWVVQRDVVEYYANHLPALMKLGSVRANHTPEGKLYGFRVGIAKCSLLREGGLRTGDVVTSVNGLEVHDVFGALGAYFALRTEKHIEVRLIRRGKYMTLGYDLV